MGKSPAKWIKTLLSSKKSGRSHSTKGRDASKAASDKGNVKGKDPASTENSPVISEPVLVSSHSNETVATLVQGTPSSLGGDGVLPVINQDVDKQGIAGSDALNCHEKLREEQAATKAQAAFRGYLARRAFHALKGIIRLQALIRGHLVRRQAVSTLHAMRAIVRLQALVRGTIVRRSGFSLDVSTKFCQQKVMDSNTLDAWKEKLSKKSFIYKLLSCPTVLKPLLIQYDRGDPNSVFMWLERWTVSHFWKPISQPRKIDAKSQARRGNYAMETESGKSKRSVRRNPAATVDPGQTNINSEPEKPKRSLRKVSSSPADTTQEHPQTELEKVKRSLRKVAKSIVETSDHPEVESEKPSNFVQTVPGSISVSPEQSKDDNLKAKKDATLTPDKSDLEASLEYAVGEGQSDARTNISPAGGERLTDALTNASSAVPEAPIDAPTNVSSAIELQPLQSIDNKENALVINGDLCPKEEQSSAEGHKTSKRRSSFSAKLENGENGLPNSPSLPSYMATTESAKAKLRGQISPRLGSDSAEKNGFTRRHSLPSSTSGKLNSHSPRTQRHVQVSGRNGFKGDRSLSSSRDGTDRAIQVEWKR
ncbi:protein IQ-DOMAIN 31-like isoform X2 [Typha latifolia]|uniref:protein IQ-DOMAIN 31-like isoform X2 n=1 Tax=Typha latifolia TaxID=4733 RepID=UPI003C2D7C3F